jgi:hypothetical protein
LLLVFVLWCFLFLDAFFSLFLGYGSGDARWEKEWYEGWTGG